MYYRKIYLPLLAFTMAACGSCVKENAKEPVTGEPGKDIDAADLNSISVTIEGEVNQKIETRGQDVNVALLKFTKTSLEGFGIGATVVNATTHVTTSTSTGLMKIDLGAKTEQEGLAAGSVMVESGNSRPTYSGQSYFLYYETATDQRNSKAYLTLTEVTDTANLLKLRGQFRYNAAYGPEPMSQDCALEAIKNSGRLPMYNPDLCGAKKVAVKGTFTIYLDKVMQQK